MVTISFNFGTKCWSHTTMGYRAPKPLVFTQTCVLSLGLMCWVSYILTLSHDGLGIQSLLVLHK